jgi:type I restriction-modification system DNA methylase subunit
MKTLNKDEAQKLLSTAGLLLIDALVVHEVIAASHPKVPTLSKLLMSQNLKKDLEAAWQYVIRNIDYEPVLDAALRILSNIPANPVLDEQLRSLVDLAYDIASSRVLLRHDLFGRIYHTLLLGRLVKYYATYYTSIPAARLLARLLVNLPSGLDVRKVPPTYGGEPLRVVDFACGSGTLLSAIYKELDVKHRVESKEVRVDDLHKYLMEEGIWGFDVLHHAVHLAATVLSLHNPIPVNTSKLYALRLGEGRFLGSINFLSSPSLDREMVLTGEIKGGGEGISLAKKESKAITLPNFHICIMNPPFTRSVGGNLLFGSLPKEERARLQKALSQILKENDLTGIGQAGLGAVFVCLADRYLVEGGRLGLVLPRAVLSGVSWQKVRDMLLEKYQVEYIITSFEAPNSWNFSENTDLSEVLLVARKLRKGEKQTHTVFANLWRKPSNETESIYVGRQLRDLYDSARLYDIENTNASPYHLRLQGRKVGEAYSAKLAEANFGVYNILSQMELNRTILLLRRGLIYLPDEGIVAKKIPLTTLPNLGAEIGPDRRQIHSTFTVSKPITPSLYKAFWGYDSSTIKTIPQKPNASLEPKNAEQARNLWKKRGRLLVVERGRLSTYTALAVYLDEEVLSNVWWPIKVDDDIAKILAVWLNSTFGILLLLSIAEVTQGPWIDIKKDMLSDMPILDINALTNKDKKHIIQLFDEKIRNLQLKPLPEEFANPEARRVIDEAISEALNLKIKLDTIYNLLSNEPMLKGR